jgi:hypothetical protein
MASARRPAAIRFECRSIHAACLATSHSACSMGARAGSTTTTSPDSVIVSRERRARADRRTE